MNKKLLTLAVAAAMVAPGAAMAEAILYGKLNVSIDYAEVSNVVLPQFEVQDGQLVQTTLGQDFDGWGMSANGFIPGEKRANRIGVKGSEDLGNGLKAIYQVELGINLDDTNNNVLSNADAITYRNTFVGLASDWGTALVGRHDTPMKISTGKLDLFADTMADYNGTVGFRDLRADNVFAYISPSLAGFQLSGAIVPAGGATGGGNGLNTYENSLGETYSVAGIYSNGPFYASAAFENLNNEHFNTQALSNVGNNCPVIDPVDPADPNGAYTATCQFQNSAAQAWRLGLGLLDWNGFTLAAIYENQDVFNNDRYAGIIDPADPNNSYLLPSPKEAEMWQVQAGYAFGNNMIKAMYGQADYSGNDIIAGGNYISINGGDAFFERTSARINYKIETWAVGFDHNFSKRTKLYALYTAKDDDRQDIVAGTDWSGLSLGMMHSF